MSKVLKYINNLLDLGSIGDGIMITDEKANIVYFDLFKPDLFNFSTQEAIGKNILEVYPTLTPECSTIYKAIHGTPTVGAFTEERHNNGSVVTLIESSYPIIKNNEIIGAINIATHVNSISSEVSSQNANGTSPLYHVQDIVGNSSSNIELIGKIITVSQTDSPVLIYGETGTGKELVAQSIHTAGKRSGRKFLVQNCAAIPSNLLESIFFGTVKGSFTGAEDRAGIFERANHGTVFLDEINSMDYSLQPKLLRVLEEKKVTRLGDTKEIPVDVRIIASTNKSPEACVKDGDIRKDLYFRLNAVSLKIAPLREKLDDIPLLCNHFISAFNKSLHKQVEGIEYDTMLSFIRYSWPGNIRELKNVIEHMVTMSKGGILTSDLLPDYMEGNSLSVDEPDSNKSHSEKGYDGLPLQQAVEKFEKSYIESALNAASNYAQAAKKLGITSQSLYYKLKKYNLK